jgi:hypothetical protein
VVVLVVWLSGNYALTIFRCSTLNGAVGFRIFSSTIRPPPSILVWDPNNSQDSVKWLLPPKGGIRSPCGWYSATPLINIYQHIPVRPSPFSRTDRSGHFSERMRRGAPVCGLHFICNHPSSHPIFSFHQVLRIKLEEMCSSLSFPISLFVDIAL